MAPRATVQQAIELLKIYQLRRENAAIFQQVQTLRDEVSDLHNTSDNNQYQLDQIQADFQKCHALSIQNSGQISKTDTVIGSLAKTTKGLELSLTNTKGHVNGHVETLRVFYVQIEEKLKELEIKYNETEKTCATNHKRTIEELKELHKQLSRKIDEEQLELILVRSNSKKPDADSFGCKQQTIRSTSCIYESVETNNTKVDDGIEADGRVRKSTVPNDLDLDEEAANASHGSQDINFTRHDDLFVTTPYRDAAKDLSVHIEELLSLKQQSHEGVTAYIKRGYEVLQNLNSASETIAVRRLVEGLTNVDHRKKLIDRLGQTSWTRKSLEDVCLYGVVESNISEPQARLQQDALTLVTESNTSQADIQATESLNHDAQPADQETLSISTSSKETRLRRSQRLAAKSQAQAQTQSTGAIETESQAEALDARVASAAARRWSKQNKPKLKGNLPTDANVHLAPLMLERSVQAEEKPCSSVNDVGVYPYVDGQEVELRAKVARPQNKVYVNLSQHGTLAEDETTAPIPPDSPPTLAESILYARPLKILPQTPTAQPTSPLYDKVMKTRSSKFQNRKTENTALHPSPYNPQPRLVSGRNKQHSQKAYIHDLESDDEVFLSHRGDLNQQKPRAADRELPEIPRKKRKLPLPPPPQIPILSTSTEEDQRFDRW